MSIRKTIAVLGAAALTFSCMPAGAVSVSASIITDIKDKLNNDVFDYFSAVDESEGYSYAKIAMSSPACTLEFSNRTEADIKANRLKYYTGTVKIAGETYYICRTKGTGSYSTKLTEIEDNCGDMYFYHLCSTDDEAAEKTTFPIYELIQAATHFGLKTSSICSVILDNNEYECNCDVTTLKKGDEDIPYEVYMEMSKKYTDYTIVDGNDFYTREFVNGYTTEMLVRPEGRFSLITDGMISTFDDYVDSYMEKNLYREPSLYEINSANDISIDCHADISMEGNYGIVYKLNINYPSSYDRVSFRLAEKISGMDIEEFFRSYEESVGIGNHLYYRSNEFIKTYAAGGHEYDLYKVKYSFSGDTNNYDETCYFVVRKDTDDTDTVEDSMNIYDHISQIDEFASGIEIYSVELSFHNVGAKGSVDITKNNIRFVEREAPETVKGDFNNDRRIDSFDIILARNAVLSKSEDTKNGTDEAMDLNNDGSFDVADIVLLQSFILGKIKAFQ